MANVALPAFTDGVDQRYFIEPLNGPKGVHSYLDRFPDSLYSKSPNSRFVRFMYMLLGPAGIGWLRQNLLEARLQLEAQGLQLFDLEAFYGDPLSFGRILEESFNDDITGLLPAAAWDAIRMKDEAYRSRAILFMQAVRLGGTPDGMRLAAESGTGQNCEIIENYRFLFDNHSDAPLGLPWEGQTADLGEFIVKPRPAISRSEVQSILFDEAPITLGSSGYVLSYNGYSTPYYDDPAVLDHTSDTVAVQSALQALPSLGVGTVVVDGGPAPVTLTIRFTGPLSNQPVPTITATFWPNGYSAPIEIPVSVKINGISPSDEVVVIADADRHHMQVALDYLRPVPTYPTFAQGRSHLSRHAPLSDQASSSLVQVTRYVSGNANVNWPANDKNHWIEASREIEAPLLNDARSQHYVNFHNIEEITAYTDQALFDPAYGTDDTVLATYPSTHIGSFGVQSTVMPFLGQYSQDTTTMFSAPQALPEYTEFLAVTSQTADGTAFLSGSYPADYIGLQGAPPLRYNHDHFWSSASRTTGAEILEIDLDYPQAVNFITFETTRKPITISIDYDTLDLSPARRFVPIQWTGSNQLIPGQLFYDSAISNPWEELLIPCSDSMGTMIYTRFIRLTFTRRTSDTSVPFLYDPSANVQTPWSIEVRNLRIGRNLAPA